MPANADVVRALAEGLKRAGTTIAKVDTEKKLAAVFAKAADTARDAKASDSARIEAINLVTLDTPKQAVPALLACLEKSQPDAVQSAAVSALGQFSSKEVDRLSHRPVVRLAEESPHRRLRRDARATGARHGVAPRD